VTRDHVLHDKDIVELHVWKNANVSSSPTLDRDASSSSVSGCRHEERKIRANGSSARTAANATCVASGRVKVSPVYRQPGGSRWISSFGMRPPARNAKGDSDRRRIYRL